MCVGTMEPGHIPPEERGESFAVSLGTVQTWSGPGKAGEWLPALPKLLPTTGRDKDTWSCCWDSHHQP